MKRCCLGLLLLILLPLAASRINGDPLPGVVLSFESKDGTQTDARESR
jgi:hypothetical protein